MSCKMAHMIAIGMTIVLAPLALAGCLEPPADDLASSQSASEERPSPISPAPLAVCSPLFIAEERPLTCQSGWPNAQFCVQAFSSPTDIEAPTVASAINGPVGEVAGTRMVYANGTREVHFEVWIRSGDLFSPGKNTTSYTVSWCRQRTN